MIFTKVFVAEFVGEAASGDVGYEGRCIYGDDGWFVWLYALIDPGKDVCNGFFAI